MRFKIDGIDATTGRKRTTELDAPGRGRGAVAGFTRRWTMSALGDRLERILEKLKNVRDKAAALGDSTEPSDEDKEEVDAWLVDAEADLAVIHDENQSPSLDPTSAGEVMEVTIPASRLQTCADALELAQEAEAEAKKASPDYDYIGDRTRTLEATYTAAIRAKFEL